ncbi:MAG: FecR domain-containing protein [Bacteroidia bacterium]|nr:FecR domain-containing protein [Bacteroidia bacterium]
MDKWSQNDLTTEEKLQLLQALDESAGEASFAQIWDEYWEADQQVSAQVLDSRLEAVRQHIKALIKAETAPARVRRLRPVYGIWAAAVAACLVMAGVWLWQYPSPSVSPLAAAEQPVYQTVSVGRGERVRRVSLPDGTVVWLNVDSRLSFPVTFGPDERPVTLEGEAYFEVVRDTARPFSVMAQGIRTEVLGTAFYVSAYAESSVAVALVSGKVAVSDQKGRHITLMPQQQVLADTNVRVWQATGFRPGINDGWREGLLTYADIPLGVLAPTLERWYNINIQFGDEASRRCAISGNPTHKSIWDLLASFQFIHGITYETDTSGTIIIRGGSCP